MILQNSRNYNYRLTVVKTIKNEKAERREEMLEAGRKKVQQQLKMQIGTVFSSNKKEGMSEEEKEKRLRKIEQKLKNGKKLTAEEMSFIQRYYPEKYPAIKRIQVMRESLEDRLEHASSKEEVQDIYALAVGMVSEKDPYKEEVLSAYQDALQEFKKSSAYQKLPQKTEDKKKGKQNHPYHKELEDEVRKAEYQFIMPEFDLHM